MHKILKFIARRIHNVKIQVLLATIYGLIDIFGYGATFAIMLKMKKLVQKEQFAHARKTKSNLS
jgi:hypothetical protein